MLLTPEQSPTTVILSYLFLKSLAIWGLVQGAVGMWREGWYSKHRICTGNIQIKISKSISATDKSSWLKPILVGSKPHVDCNLNNKKVGKRKPNKLQAIYNYALTEVQKL